MKERYGSSPRITYISHIDRLCNADGCLTFLDGNPKEGLITYDYGHFTLPASRYVVQNFITPVLERADGRQLLRFNSARLPEHLESKRIYSINTDDWLISRARCLSDRFG